MNKKAKTTNILLILFIVGIIFVGIFYVYPYIQTSAKIKTIAEHKIPSDLTKEEQDQGFQLKLYDKDGKEIVIPEWFKVSSVINPTFQEFTVIKHTAVPCTTRVNCPGYALNPAIDCWNSVCALKGVSAMDMGVSVINPPSSTVNFLNLKPTITSILVLSQQLDKTVFDKLIPGQTKTWMTTTPIIVAQFEGTSQTFGITIEGTNEYTGEVISASDSIQLQFGADPTGAFQVVIQSPI